MTKMEYQSPEDIDLKLMMVINMMKIQIMFLRKKNHPMMINMLSKVKIFKN